MKNTKYRILFLLFILPLILYFLTCDRADMYTIGKYGPEPDVIYFFTDAATTYDGSFPGYDGPRQACLEVFELYLSFLEITRIEPLLSTTDMAANDIVPDVYSHVKVMGVDTGQTTYLISNSWNGLWDGALDGPVSSMGISGNYWTGSTISGTLSTANCNGWSDTAGTGTQGDGTATNFWINSGTNSCAAGAGLICVGY